MYIQLDEENELLSTGRSNDIPVFHPGTHGEKVNIKICDVPEGARRVRVYTKLNGEPHPIFSVPRPTSGLTCWPTEFDAPSKGGLVEVTAEFGDETATMELLVDLAPPLVTRIKVLSNRYESDAYSVNPVRLGFSVADDASWRDNQYHCDWTINGRDSGRHTDNLEISLPRGSHEVILKLRDPYGLESVEKSHKFIVDDIPPDVSLVLLNELGNEIKRSVLRGQEITARISVGEQDINSTIRGKIASVILYRKRPVPDPYPVDFQEKEVLSCPEFDHPWILGLVTNVRECEFTVAEDWEINWQTIILEAYDLAGNKSEAAKEIFVYP